MSEQFRTPGNLFFDMPSFSADGSRGVFHFFPLPENPRAAEGCYQVTGVFNETSGALAIIPGAWYLRPRNYLPAAFNGTVDARGENFEGRIVGLEGCASGSCRAPRPCCYCRRSVPAACHRGGTIGISTDRSP